MDWGTFSWPKFIELLPIYVGGFGSVALLIATFWQVRDAKIEASKRAALEYFRTLVSNPEYDDFLNQIAGVKAKYPDATVLCNPQNDEEVSAYELVIRYLDQVEVMATGILFGGLSNDFCEDYTGPHLISNWEYLKDFVYTERQTDDDFKAFVNFEAVIKNWSKKKV